MLARRTLLAASAATLLRPRPARAADRTTIVLDWLLNPNHAALFAGVQAGAFAKAGLEVDLIAPADPDSPPRLVAAGQADLAVSYGSQINMLASAGLPVLRIASLIDRPLNTIMAISGRGIGKLADLKGKQVGVSVGGVEEAILYAMLNNAGLAKSDVTVVKVNYNMVTALVTGKLDAAIGAYRNNEVLQVKMMNLQPVIFTPEENGVPPYDELILIARKDRARDPRMARLVTALRQATTTLLAAPDHLWPAFAAAHPELDTKLMQASWKATLPALARDPAHLDAARYLAFQDFALRRGIIPRALPLGDFAVQMA